MWTSRPSGTRPAISKGEELPRASLAEPVATGQRCHPVAPVGLGPARQHHGLCGRAPGFEHRRAVRRLDPDDVADPNGGSSLHVSERCGRRSGCQPDLPGHRAQPSGWRRVERPLYDPSHSMVRGRSDWGASDSPRPFRKRRRQTVCTPGATVLFGKPGARSCGSDPTGRSGDGGPDFPTDPPRSKPATGRPLPRAIPLRSAPMAIRT